jgi:predicted metal-dependent hydrolase
MMEKAYESNSIRVRRPRFEFGSNVSNHWLNGNSVDTHLANVFHATIPAGERFIIRTLVRLQKKTDPALSGVVKAFIGQEGQHAAAHDSFSKVLQTRGYDVKKLNQIHDSTYRWLERSLPSSVCLAMAAAAEHYTAVMGDAVLGHQERLEGVNSEIKKLLLWHAAEEVEHKSLVFDVLQSVNSSYFLRALGFVLASGVLGLSVLFSVISLMRADLDLSFSKILEDYRRGIGRLPMGRSIFAMAMDYLRPSFHPSQKGDLDIAVKFLSALEN